MFEGRHKTVGILDGNDVDTAASRYLAAANVNRDSRH